LGYNDFPGGHITVRQPDDTFLHNPWGLDWDELRASDVIRIDKNGTVVEGRGRVTPAVVLHLRFHDVRQDVHVLIHNHPRYSTIWACRHQVPTAYEQTASLLRDDEIVVMDTYAGAVHDPNATNANVLAIGNANIALLANHGVLVAGRDLAEAYRRAVILETRARIALELDGVGAAVPMPESGKKSMQAAAELHREVMQDFWWNHAIRRELQADPQVVV
jgi:ribulose-5-phosphate 4-epimerase/fuculose-1-phosphate aldolase